MPRLIWFGNSLVRAEAQLQEARNWEHTEVVLMQHILRDPAMKEEDFVALAVHDAAELHGAAVYVLILLLLMLIAVCGASRLCCARS